MPQPSAWLLSRSSVISNASAINDATMPNDEARNCSRILCRSRCSTCKIEPSLMPNTGSTHGIRLRIRPPASAISTACHSEKLAATGEASGPSIGSFTCCATPPSPITNVRVLPRRSGALSPQPSLTGTRANIRVPSLLTFGLPRSASSSVSKNSSGCCQPAARSALICSSPF
ncbi:hypothetical protein D3C78_982200 [compost metagenome]